LALATAIPRKAGILKRYHELPIDLKEYLKHFPGLANDYPWNVSISYLFAQLELSQNMIIYGAVVKIHRVDAVMARAAINKHHMTRTRFRDLYKIVIGKSIRAAATELAKDAELIRDQILHGKPVSDGNKRKAVVSTLEYISLLNEQVYVDAKFRPCGSMKGFKGRAKPLDKKTSRWVLIGMGLYEKQKNDET
jgi:hypothetical protein